MAQTVRVYVKKKLRLDMLTIPQRTMYAIGMVGLKAIKNRTARAIGSNDLPAPPLKSRRRRRWSKSQNKWVEYGNPISGWAKIKVKRGLKPIRDLRGTGLMFPAQYRAYRGLEVRGKDKAKLKNVGHLMEQMSVRRVATNRVFIDEPTTVPGRMKARRNRDMLLFSPSDRASIIQYARTIFGHMVNKIVRRAA